ncbi:MAG: T9SS type A sorting domain-containing protein [Bacteroidia bacterium]
MKYFPILVFAFVAKAAICQVTQFTPAMVNPLGGSGNVGATYYDYTVGEPIVLFGGTGCDSIFSGFQHSAIDTPRINKTNVNISGSTTFCLGQSVVLTAPSGASYLWSTKATTQSITAAQSGTYRVTVTNTCGDTIGSNNIVLTTINPPIVSLCMVTVDTSSTHNIIVWDTTGLTRVDSFKIYFQNSASIWQLIKEVPFHGPNYLVDSTPINNPLANTVRYLLTDVDSCGNEEDTTSSIWQNTAFLPFSGTGTFNWAGNGYLIEGVTTPVKTYRLFRDTMSNGHWQAIDSVAGTQNQMTDPNYSKYPLSRYRLDAELYDGGCPYNADLRPGHTVNNTTTRSNTQHNISFTPVLNPVYASASILVYPNPATQTLNIKFNGIKAGLASISIVDVAGREICSELSIENGELSMNIGNLSSGIYFVKVTTNTSSQVVKFVKE